MDLVYTGFPLHHYIAVDLFHTASSHLTL